MATKPKSSGTDVSAAKKTSSPENPQHLQRRNGVESTIIFEMG